MIATTEPTRARPVSQRQTEGADERDLIRYARTLGGNDVDCLVYADYYRHWRAVARAKREWPCSTN